jgi:hypothetical protein
VRGNSRSLEFLKLGRILVILEFIKSFNVSNKITRIPKFHPMNIIDRDRIFQNYFLSFIFSFFITKIGWTIIDLEFV